MTEPNHLSSEHSDIRGWHAPLEVWADRRKQTIQVHSTRRKLSGSLLSNAMEIEIDPGFARSLARVLDAAAAEPLATELREAADWAQDTRS